MTSIPATALLFLTWLAAAPAAALASPGEANALVLRGLDLRRAGRSEEALELFRRAYEQAPSPRTLGQMGLVETSLQRWLAADAHLAATLTTPDDVWVHRNRIFLDQAVKRTRAHIGELDVTGPPGAQITLDRDPAGTLPLEGPLRSAEGTFTLTATAAGYKPFSAEITIKGNTRAAITIVLEPLDLRAPAPADAGTPIAAPAPGSREEIELWGGVSLLVAGGAGLAGGIGWLVIDGRPTCTGCVSVYNTRTGGYLLAGAGALALAGGSILLLARHERNRDLTLGTTGRSVELLGTF